MFKLQFNHREGAERREQNVIGHDRFCQQKHFSLPRYKKKRTSRRTQAETELAFELLQLQANSDEVASTSSAGKAGRDRDLYRSRSFHNSGGSGSVSGFESSSSSKGQNGRGRHRSGNGSRPGSAGARRTLQIFNQDTGTGEHVIDGQLKPSWCRYFASLAGTFSCCEYKNGDDKRNCVYNRLGTSSDELDPKSASANGIGKTQSNLRNAQVESTNARAHELCMKYLESMTGRYVLISRLPQIGSRVNRLWYLVHDTYFNTKRLLTVTPYRRNSAASSLYNSSISASTDKLKEICQALQHAYVSPILDLAVLDDPGVGPLIVTLSATSDGSLRDLLSKSRWTDGWDAKYREQGSGIPEIQVQRLSCHILEALLHLRSKGLPPGIGAHFHPGNILIQHGIARFSAIDNILFSHPNSSDSKRCATPKCPKLPEAVDSMAFANLLFSMCSGYELASMKLSDENWEDIRDYPQVCEVIEFILGKPEISPAPPHLQDIAKLEFYRNVDLRELNTLPGPNILSGAPNNALTVFVESLENSHKSLQKSHSASTARATTTAIMKETDNNSLNLSLQSPDLDPSSRNSSQMSLYWTPPSSLGFIAKECDPTLE